MANDSEPGADAPGSLPPGAKVAILDGDPTKPGPFVMRARLPDGYKIPPHTHPQAERMTVLSGSLRLGMGDTFDPKHATELTPGTYAALPPGMKHFAWAEGETVIQVHGEGPWVIEYVNPADDPRKKR
jgi:quercetin dioxygenase-like cupin family protein